MRLALRVREALASAQVDGGRLVLAERLDTTVYDHVARAIEGAGGVRVREGQAFMFASGDAAAAIAPLLLVRDEADAKPNPASGPDRLLPDPGRPARGPADPTMLAMDDHDLMLRERKLKRRWRTAFLAVVLAWAALAWTALLLDPEPAPRVCGSPSNASTIPIPHGDRGAPWAANA